MKKTLTLLAITTVLSLGVYAQQPLTQFYLVEVLDNGTGVSFRDNEEMARRLRQIGFKVSTYKRPSHSDEMATYIALKASRKAKNGTTYITVTRGEDVDCIIDFASKAEISKFVSSMRKSKYEQEGTLFSHPQNCLGKIYVRVSNLRVKIICPFEMIPYDF